MSTHMEQRMADPCYRLSGDREQKLISALENALGREYAARLAALRGEAGADRLLSEATLALEAAREALCAHRTPVQPEPRCEPPDGNRGGRDQHWLTSDIGDDAIVATWAGKWIWPSNGDVVSPEEVYENGWRYRSVARPGQVEITDEQISDLWAAKGTYILGGKSIAVQEFARSLIAKATGAE